MYEQNRRCPSCGAEVYNPTQQYCLNCGAQLTAQSSAYGSYGQQSGGDMGWGQQNSGGMGWDQQNGGGTGWGQQNSGGTGWNPPIMGGGKTYNLLTAYQAFFTKYAVFSGRSRRQEYWFAYLANYIVSMLLSIPYMICSFMFVQERARYLNSYHWYYGYYTRSSDKMEIFSILTTIFAIIMLLYALATLIPNLSITCRRLHDSGKSGKLLLLHLVPGAFITMAVFTLLIAVEGHLDRMISYSDAGLFVMFMILGVISALAISITFLVFCCLDSDRGMNKYGMNPKGY